MRTIVGVIDSISEWTGKIVRWACLALVMVLVYEVTARYVFNAPTIWAHETSCMLGITIVALGWAYVHQHHGHVRVDVFYARFSPRGKAITDIICALLFFFPLVILLMDASARWAWKAWLFNEVLIESYWYPPALPIRIVVLLGLSLFALQGLAEFIRDLYFVIRSKTLD